MTTLHPFSTSRESVLQIWSLQAQTRRSLPESRVADLFVLLHGMLFTNIQLDDFKPTLARFMERLQLEGAEEREWIMMAVINITSLLEYGKPTGVLRSTGGIGSGAAPGGKDTSTAAQAAAASARVNMLVRRVDQMEVDDADSAVSPIPESQPTDINMANSGVLNVSPITGHATAALREQNEYPLGFKFALKLTFDMLIYTLRTPMRKATQFARPTLNPYNTIVLTFLATVMKHAAVQKILERSIPWEDLATFFGTIPRAGITQIDGGRLTAGCTPLPEDWCLRGMEWGGRRLFERGFWKGAEGQHVELEVLDTNEEPEGLTDGIIEDEDDERVDPGESKNSKRWTRIARASGIIAKTVPGFKWEAGTRSFEVTGLLEQKVGSWREEERMEREEEERRRIRNGARNGRMWGGDDMDVDGDINQSTDEDALSDDDSGSSSDVEESEEVRALKVSFSFSGLRTQMIYNYGPQARRRELLRMLRGTPSSPKQRTRPRRSRTIPSSHRPLLRVVPGYTVLVIDTNFLLSSLSMFSTLVESQRWTILVPLAVVTELDGIRHNNTALGEAAQAAIHYIEGHVRSHALSLKVQTSKGNYLRDLNVRSEDIEFGHQEWERSMDDLILKAAVWQDEHWVDRSTLLNSGDRDTSGAAKVVLISLDRNCRFLCYSFVVRPVLIKLFFLLVRLKARARQLDAADERDIAAILKNEA